MPVELRKIGVQYDHNVNTIEFVGPRYSSNVDLSTMTIYINYILSDKTTGKYKAENVIIDDQDDSLIRFNWTITRNVTKVSGILSCLVCAKKTDEEGNEINHWNTDIFRLLSVSEGMENDLVIQERYPDVITSLIQNVNEHDAKLLEFSGLDTRVTDIENNVNELKDDLSQLSEEIVDCIKSPASAEVGQIVKIAAVDENGKPTAWEPADMSSSIQPDWNQNDENAQDYVKNRPFYIETRNVTVENTKDEILEHFPVFAVGDTITVNVDGEEHSLVAYYDDGYVTIGDASSSLDSREGPLRWQIYVGEDKDVVYYYALEPHTVSYLGTFYHTIDKKYLPIGIQSHAVDGVIYFDIYNKTYTLSDGLVFDSLFGKRLLLVLLYDDILRYGEICYLSSASDNTLSICHHSYEYNKDSDEFVLSVSVYLLSSDGKFTDKTKQFILTQPNIQ